MEKAFEVDEEDFDDEYDTEDEPTFGHGKFDPVKNEDQLFDLLARDIRHSYKTRILFLAGHFPLLYDNEGAYAATSTWGDFTPYSLEMACSVAAWERSVPQALEKIAQSDLPYTMKRFVTTMNDDAPKEIKFVLLADDINYEDIGKNAAYDRHNKSRKRNTFYRSMSGPDAQLPREFQEIFDRYGFTTNDVLRHNHGKPGRNNCLFFSERILRTRQQQESNETECAKAYRGLIESPYFNKETDYLVAFLPDRCTGNVCERVLDGISWQWDEKSGKMRVPQSFDPYFSASHIAMQTDSMLLHRTNQETIWKNGVRYRKDFYRYP
jgi:hypothetical protein